MSDPTAVVHGRTLFLSDIHLGTKGCQADKVIDFLRAYDADTIYLVGDVFDGWRLRAAWYWPQSHNDVVQKILRKARKGARLVFIPGNHDEFLRPFCGAQFGGIEIVEEAIHVTADGRRVLVLHGDKFDPVVRNIKWLAHLGDWAYDLAIFIGRHISTVRRRLDLPYWSFSNWCKQKVKSAVNAIGAFEAAVASDAARNSADTVICGHIHRATDRMIGEVRYLNCGDWVESCTAIMEHHDGRFELIHWSATPVSVGSGAVPLPVELRPTA